MCISPRNIVQTDRYGKRIVRRVPCGKCCDCLKDYQNSVKLRAYYQWLMYPKAVFFTLSYDRNNLPLVFDKLTGEVLQDEFCDTSERGKRYNRQYVSSVCVDDVQKWLKRGRRRYFYRHPSAGRVSYYITSEYGPKSLRPHYHGIIYNISLDDFNAYFVPAWGKGNIDRSELKVTSDKNPMKVTNYVSKYCSKGFFENPRVKQWTVKKTFHLVSNHFGLGVLDRLIDTILPEGLPLDCYQVDKFSFSGKTSFKEYREDVIFSLFSKMRDKDCYFDTSQLQEDFLPNSYLPIRTQCPDHKISCPFFRKFKSYKKVVEGPKVLFFPLKKEVVESICKRLILSFTDLTKSKTFSYALPRYYKNYLFGTATPISKQIAKYLSESLSKRMDRKASARLAANTQESKSHSLKVAYHTHFIEDFETKVSRQQEFNTKYAKFLSASKF